MHPLELAKEALRQTSRKKCDEKLDEFAWALTHTKEGKRLREMMRPVLAKVFGI